VLLVHDGAAVNHLGTVRYAAPDATWYGVDQLPQINHHIARRWGLNLPGDQAKGGADAVFATAKSRSRTPPSHIDSLHSTQPERAGQAHRSCDDGRVACTVESGHGF